MLVLLDRLTDSDKLSSYPDVITRGYANNMFKHINRSLMYQNTDRFDQLMICLYVASICPNYDLYWSKFSVVNTNKEQEFKLPDNIDLVRNITIYGATYASLNGISMVQKEDSTWEINSVLMHRIFTHNSIQTDGSFIYCELGIFLKPDKRNKYIVEATFLDNDY